jgi:hypothetical protein
VRPGLPSSGETVADSRCSTDHIASSRKVAIVSLALVVFALNSILVNGIEYVSQPRLARQTLDDILSYTGKGYE